MRVKRGVSAHKKHKKLIKQAKGMQHARRSSSRMASQGVVRSLQYAYRDRRTRKRDFRSLWITRINAAAKANGTTYSQLIQQLKASDIQLDRKVLAELAAQHPEVFKAVLEQASKSEVTKDNKKAAVKV